MLQGNRGVIFSIECFQHWLSSWIIKQELKGDWHLSNMEVMVGDNEGRNFGALTIPWGDLPVDQVAIHISMFIKDSETIVLISARNKGLTESAIYWLEGKIVPK